MRLDLHIYLLNISRNIELGNEKDTNSVFPASVDSPNPTKT